ncbi:MAG: AraC family ligand binding domain-containing protein [Clostridia bacterium]|nr:AraC family ligand binding domain-containing protein [Clostridia bacterium]
MANNLIERLIRHTLDNPSFLLKNKSNDEKFIIEGSRIMEKEKLIAVRADTNTKHFPEHCHDYVEITYMYQGTKTNIINNETVVLNEGDILFMTQNCRQENLPATDYDIAVNFIVLPQFFEKALEMLNSEESLLHSFIIQCLRGENGYDGYQVQYEDDGTYSFTFICSPASPDDIIRVYVEQ